MKKFSLCILMLTLFFTTNAYAMPELLPEDIGSNSKLIEILNPEDEDITSYSETYLISCFAEPNTELTLYRRLVESYFVPITVDNEAITCIVGESGVFAVDMTFEPNSTNEIMFYAEKDGRYQSEFRTIIIAEEEEKPIVQKHKALKIRDFIESLFN